MLNRVTKFLTNSEIEVQAITTNQMREVDRIAIEETGPNLFQMMENAGRNLATLALQTLGVNWEKSSVLILAGSGGNGGGAICAARHLANRGIKISLCLSSKDHLGEVTAWQRKIFQMAGGMEVQKDQLDKVQANLILDGLIGYGLSAAPHGSAAELIDWANHQKEAHIISLDVPSGLDSTTGETPGGYIKANTTMTLALPKTGLVPNKTGDLYLADIGIPKETYIRVEGIEDYQSPFGNQYLISLNPKNKFIFTL